MFVPLLKEKVLREEQVWDGLQSEEFRFGHIGAELFDKQVKISNKVIRANNHKSKGEVRARDINLKVSNIKNF